MTDKTVVVELKNVSKVYKLFVTKTERMKEALHPFKKKYHKEFYALNDMNFTVRKGEILGIVGMNGSGKSTLLKIVAGIIQPTTGTIQVKGNVVPLLELGSGFNPEFSGLENIYFYNSIMGHSRKKTDAIVKQILDFAEIGDFIHQPLKTYSSGMKARLSFAVSVNINPDILIVDEVLSVGDELFRRKSFAKIEEFFKAGKTILFVSHSAANINQLCSRAIMLNQGKIVLDGTPKFVTMNYNKFMFSNSKEREALLKEFAGNSGLEPGSGNDFLISEQEEQDRECFDDIRVSTQKAYLIPNFVPKSTVITCPANLRVHSLKIEALNGVKVNALVQHEEYIFSYIVEHHAFEGRVNYSMAFKDERGFILSWRYYPDKHKYISREIQEGDTNIVKWKFKCLFTAGTYFINIGIRRDDDGKEALLFKGADIFAFKVLGDDITDKGGFFDSGISFSLSNTSGTSTSN